MSKRTDMTSDETPPKGVEIPPGIYTVKCIGIEDGYHMWRIVSGKYSGNTFRSKVEQPKF